MFFNRYNSVMKSPPPPLFLKEGGQGIPLRKRGMKGDLYHREEHAVLHSDDPISHGRPFLAVCDEDDGFSLFVP